VSEIEGDEGSGLGMISSEWRSVLEQQQGFARATLDHLILLHIPSDPSYGARLSTFTPSIRAITPTHFTPAPFPLLFRQHVVPSPTAPLARVLASLALLEMLGMLPYPPRSSQHSHLSLRSRCS
jgi:hypothetical protein